MIKLIQNEFALNLVEIKKLNGYDNENYHVKTDIDSYIFKTYHYSQNIFALVEAENKALLFLKEKGQKNIPEPFPFIDGSFVKIIEIKGRKTICRLLSFLEGEFLGELNPTNKLFRSIGAFLAKMDLILLKFDSYTIKARQWDWDIQYLNLNKQYIQDITNARDRSTVQYFFQQFEENVTPVLPDLRKSIIHNDANEWNILFNGGGQTGIIDFGDLAYSSLINELAIAISYASFDHKEPLEVAVTILESYHSILPLEEKELSILYYLIASRLCISVCNSAHSKKENEENEYAFVSENSAWKLLYRLLSINPIEAENCFRKAAGFPPRQPELPEKVLERRHRSVSHILSVSYDKPIHMVRSAFQYMYDANGNTFLDAYNNIPHVGHSHPNVVEAGQKQMAKLNTNTRYLYDILPDYAEQLLLKFPPSLNKVYFVNSGSEASDLAIRMAKYHTQNIRIMVMEYGYHGNTQAAMEISDYKFNNPKGEGKKKDILLTQIPDVYRGKYKDEDGAGKLYVKEALKEMQSSEAPIAAFISEPILGCAGQIPLARGYLKELYPAIRHQGGVCISDEVQTGFGRLGEYFWGYEEHEVIPDIVILGKPMANGHPVGAVVTTSEIAESFTKGVEFFSSFGGNPVSCAIGLAVLDVIEEEGLQENAQTTGDYYKSMLVELKNKYACIGDVRGSGLFLGVEIIEEKTMAPDGKLAHYIKNELRNKNILISTDGPFDNVLKTKPPLIFNRENAQSVVDCIDNVLKKYYKNYL